MEEVLEKRLFNLEEMKRAENALLKLAKISADFWAEAFLSNDFILNGMILDFQRGRYDRVQKVLETEESRPVTMEETEAFKYSYLKLTKEKIQEILKRDCNVAAILGQKEKEILPQKESISDFAFSGWATDATGEVAKAMKEVGIKGYMQYGSKYRHRYIRLLVADGTIRDGAHHNSQLLGFTR